MVGGGRQTPAAERSSAFPVVVEAALDRRRDISALLRTAAQLAATLASSAAARPGAPLAVRGGWRRSSWWERGRQSTPPTSAALWRPAADRATGLGWTQTRSAGQDVFL